MAKRPPRAVVIRDLEALIDQGRTLAGQRFLKVQDLAEAAIARMEWTHQATRLLTYFPRGGVQAYADFMRAAGPAQFVAADTLESQSAHFSRTLGAQVDALDTALTALKNARTRPLKT